jgi:chromosome segregation ATPase
MAKKAFVAEKILPVEPVKWTVDVQIESLQNEVKSLRAQLGRSERELDNMAQNYASYRDKSYETIRDHENEMRKWAKEKEAFNHKIESLVNALVTLVAK